MFKIGQFSKLTGLSLDTLRHWDAIGLLPPARVEPDSGYRLYEAAQLLDANRILALKEAGCSLMEIGGLLAGTTPQALLALLEEKALDMQRQLDAQQARLDRLLGSIFLLKNGGIPVTQEITVKAIAPILICSQRRQIAHETFNSSLDAMWPAVNAHIDRMHGKRVIPCLMLSHAADWEHPGGILDLEVAEPLAQPIPEGDGIRVYSLPAVERMACVVHKGPFSTIGPTYDALNAWIEQNGYKATGPSREIYHKGDWATDDEAEYITELQIPIG